MRDWVLTFRQSAVAAGVDAGRSDAEFLRWFDLAGIQRHLKVLGIFARLWHRDGKAEYLDDLPVTLGYVMQVSARYPALAGLNDFLQRHAISQLAAARTRALTGPRA